jgi:outer membrane protein assembly factor BamB
MNSARFALTWKLSVALCSLSFVVCNFRCEASDWLQFRGPNGHGSSDSAKIPLKLKIDWAAKLPGRGLSSVLVIGDKVFVTAASGPKQDRLHVFCLKSGDGSVLWERQLKATGRTMTQQKTCVAAPSPCSDGKRVFAIWSCNDLAAFDLEGNLLWLRGITSDYPNVSNSLGMAASPLVIGDALVVPVENDSESYTIGVDAGTGRNLWKMERPKAANWSSPIAWQGADGRTVAVLQSKEGLVGVDPNTGSRLWEYKDGASTMASSVADKGVIYATSHGITAIKPGTSGAEPKQLWRAEQMNPGTASTVVMSGKIYALNSAGVLNQADVATGGKGWKLRLVGPFSASPVGAGHHIVAVNEKGLVQIVDTDAPEGAVVASLDLKDKLTDKENILSTPSLAGPAIYVRGDGYLWKIAE